MYRSWNHERQAVTYTCMLWRADREDPVVVTVDRESDDRWVGRRVVASASSVEPPFETFLKSEWRRDEKALAEPQPDAGPPPPVVDARSRYLRAFKGITP